MNDTDLYFIKGR